MITFCRLLLSSFTVDGKLPVMQILLICLLTLSNLIFSQSLTVTPAFNASPAGFQNPTLRIPQMPQGFELAFEIGGPKLRITSCLMNAVAALKEIALGDWDSKIIDGTEYRLESYPEVSFIVTAAKRKRSIQARFVLWAVCLGTFELIAQRKFEFTQIEMTWQMQRLGWLQIVNHPNSAGLTVKEGQANATLGSLNTSTNLSISNQAIEPDPVNFTVVMPDNANDPDEARLNVTFEPYGDPLTIYDIFVPVMSGMTDMAPFPSTYQSSHLEIGIEGFRGYICVMPSRPPRTEPPFLEYGWLIRTIARIPAYMLGKGRFGEIVMKIVVDEVAVGYGRVSLNPLCDADTVLPLLAGVAES